MMEKPFSKCDCDDCTQGRALIQSVETAAKGSADSALDILARLAGHFLIEYSRDIHGGVSDDKLDDRAGVFVDRTARVVDLELNDKNPARANGGGRLPASIQALVETLQRVMPGVDIVAVQSGEVKQVFDKKKAH